MVNLGENINSQAGRRPGVFLTFAGLVTSASVFDRRVDNQPRVVRVASQTLLLAAEGR